MRNLKFLGMSSDIRRVARIKSNKQKQDSKVFLQKNSKGKSAFPSKAFGIIVPLSSIIKKLQLLNALIFLAAAGLAVDSCILFSPSFLRLACSGHFLLLSWLKGQWRWFHGTKTDWIYCRLEAVIVKIDVNLKCQWSSYNAKYLLLIVIAQTKG